MLLGGGRFEILGSSLKKEKGKIGSPLGVRKSPRAGHAYVFKLRSYEHLGGGGETLRLQMWKRAT